MRDPSKNQKNNIIQSMKEEQLQVNFYTVSYDIMYIKQLHIIVMFKNLW